MFLFSKLTDPSLSPPLPFVRLRNLPIRPRFFFRGPRGISLWVDPPDSRESMLESRTIPPPNSESIDCIDDILPSSTFHMAWSCCCIDWSSDKLLRYRLPFCADDREIRWRGMSGVSVSVDWARRILPRRLLSRSFSSSQARWYFRRSSEASVRRARTHVTSVVFELGDGLRLFVVRRGGFACSVLDEPLLAWYGKKVRSVLFA